MTDKEIAKILYLVRKSADKQIARLPDDGFGSPTGVPFTEAQIEFVKMLLHDVVWMFGYDLAKVTGLRHVDGDLNDYGPEDEYVHDTYEKCLVTRREWAHNRRETQ